MTLPKPIILITFALASNSMAAETRYHQYTERFANPDDGAEVVSAGYFGGAGHEWLAAGGFSPDGTIVLAGNVIGPEFGQAEILGRDGTPPKAPERIAETDSKGNPKLEKDGSPKFKPLSWANDGTTGFLIRTSPDLRKVISTHRLPWESGTITACLVAPDGSIYIAGKASDNITSLSKNIRALEQEDNGMESGQTDHTFIAKLAPDASGVEWVRHLKGPSNAPGLEMMNDGSLKFTAQDLRNISPDGEEIARLVVQRGLSHITAVNPADGSIIRVGEHHSPTGREPWRCPVFNVYNPDDTRRHQFYDWLGPYVGLDNLRLVSDTAVRRVTFDNDGNIVLYLWSDGGNSIALREPFDIRSMSPNMNGLGFSAWGAGVLSAGYLVKIDPTTYRVKNGTMWMAYLENQNKPNSAWIDQLTFAPDGSACFTGRAANSIIQTGNRLSPTQNGQHVVILRDDLSSIRFSSAMPGTGAVKTGNAEEAWGIASTSNGKRQRVLFLTGSSGATGEFESPVKNASQETYGGGWSDGYALLLEMDHSPRAESPSRGSETEEWTVATGGKKASLTDSKDRGPVEGQVFEIEPMKWVTADAEFRDPSGKLWPAFLYGKPEKGSFEFDPKRPSLEATINCNRICQPKGTETGRVLGPAEMKDEQEIDFEFEIRSIGPLDARTETRMNGKREEKRTIIFATSDCVMTLAGRSVPVKAETRFNFQYSGKDKKPSGVQIDTHFTATAKTLGLKNPDPDAQINIRVSVKAQGSSKG